MIPGASSVYLTTENNLSSSSSKTLLTVDGVLLLEKLNFFRPNYGERCSSGIQM
jgi:hypothetical protein